MARSTYALLVALLPATAAAIGAVVLAQFPGPVELGAIGLVVGGVAVHEERPTKQCDTEAPSVIEEQSQ